MKLLMLTLYIVGITILAAASVDAACSSCRSSWNDECEAASDYAQTRLPRRITGFGGARTDTAGF